MLRSHAREKDSWHRCILVTSKDSNLTKDCIRYLELRLIEMACDAQRSDVTNATASPLIALPKADTSDLEGFLSQVEIALPVLGVSIFRSARRDISIPLGPKSQDVLPPKFTLKHQREGLLAQATDIDGEFTVLTGLQSRGSRIGSGSEEHFSDQREADVTIDFKVAPAVVTRDQVFASPSAASAIATGHSLQW